MTPAEELTAAADKLDALASGAVRDWRVDDDNQLGLVSIVTPLSVRSANAGGRYSFTGPDDATTSYIAAMNPLVGKALATHMRHEAERSERYALNGLRFDGHPALLEIARLINGGETNG